MSCNLCIDFQNRSKLCQFNGDGRVSLVLVKFKNVLCDTYHMRIHKSFLHSGYRVGEIREEFQIRNAVPSGQRNIFNRVIRPPCEERSAKDRNFSNVLRFKETQSIFHERNFLRNVTPLPRSFAALLLNYPPL